MILGVTGGIAAGKSLVSELFRQLGAEVVSADQLAREAVAPGSPVLHRLVAQFGEEILTPQGELDRKVLAERIFADPTARQHLNRIIHPAIAALAEERLQAAARRSSLVVYEAPLLFEAGAEKRVDAVLAVRIDDELQLQRLMTRDGLSRSQAQARVAAQLSQEEKVGRADFVIDNSGSPTVTEAQVRGIYRRLVPSAVPDPAENG
ncbi:MAG: dephospho-CoA kinase [Desulfuromonadales bacterium]|nr:dephospho-CoA kinase [Desulfuromonadales bacterium]